MRVEIPVSICALRCHKKGKLVTEFVEWEASRMQAFLRMLEKEERKTMREQEHKPAVHSSSNTREDFLSTPAVKKITKVSTFHVRNTIQMFIDNDLRL